MSSMIHPKKKLYTALSAALIAGASLGLSACNKPEPSMLCEGVGKFGDGSVLMTKGMCKKLAGGTAVPTKQIYRDPGADAYVECYGVAAAGENDCATNASACGGTATVDRSPTAWIAIPQGICQQIKGGVVGKLSKDSVGSGSK
jgi:uncharacterized membrane protein